MASIISEAHGDFVAGGLSTNEVYGEVKEPLAHVQELTSRTPSPALSPAPEKSVALGPLSLRDRAFSLRVGNDKDIPRWEKGSAITYSVDAHSFPSPGDCQHAEEALKQAVRPWNAMSLGVTLQPVKKGKMAVFQLVYSPDVTKNSGLLAMAFPPDADIQDRELVVYAEHFELDKVGFMTNTFEHEVGHILGLRHEFEQRPQSVRFGEKNTRSIMNYHEHLRDLHIQASDETWMRKFYAFCGPSYCGLPIKDVAIKLLPVVRRSTR